MAKGEVFLEAIGLEEVGESEGAGVAAAVGDVALEVAHEVSELFERDAGAQQLKPGSLAVKAQAQALASEFTLESVGLRDAGGVDGWGGGGHRKRHTTVRKSLHRRPG